MKRLTTLLVSILVFGFAACTSPQAGNSRQQPLLIVVSIDGFRWDYMDLHGTKNLRMLADSGSWAGRMNSAFPSKTFPNHYTLATGLRPESHGIVANTFHDPATNKNFTMARTEAYWWAQGEPIWITAEKQNVRSACLFWPGSETENQGRRPSFWRKFDKTLSCAARVDALLAWLDLPEAQRPRFCMLYFDIVDTAGHYHGPRAPETGKAAREADSAIGRLLDGLKARGLENSNLVVVSDHGMSEVSEATTVYVEQLVDMNRVEVENTGPVAGFRPKAGSGSPAELAAELRAKLPPQIKVYLREEVPAEYHYSKNPRISPVVLVADDHWSIERRPKDPTREDLYNKGSHGWDPKTENMGALFLANGPSFKARHHFRQTENINLYPLLCATLRIRPAPTDGDDSLAHEVLVEAP